MRKIATLLMLGAVLLAAPVVWAAPEPCGASGKSFGAWPNLITAEPLPGGACLLTRFEGGKPAAAAIIRGPGQVERLAADFSVTSLASTLKAGGFWKVKKTWASRDITYDVNGVRITTTFVTGRGDSGCLNFATQVWRQDGFAPPQPPPPTAASWLRDRPARFGDTVDLRSIPDALPLGERGTQPVVTRELLNSVLAERGLTPGQDWWSAVYPFLGKGVPGTMLLNICLQPPLERGEKWRVKYWDYVFDADAWFPLLPDPNCPTCRVVEPPKEPEQPPSPCPPPLPDGTRWIPDENGVCRIWTPPAGCPTCGPHTGNLKFELFR